jgi:hypothetical protein
MDEIECVTSTDTMRSELIGQCQTGLLSKLGIKASESTVKKSSEVIKQMNGFVNPTIIACGTTVACTAEAVMTSKSDLAIEPEALARPAVKSEIE